MFSRYQDKVAKCQSICVDTKANVLASEDIIPAKHMPYFLMDEKSQYIQKFGESAVSLYLQHIAYLKYIREAACEIIMKDDYKAFTYTNSKPYLSSESIVKLEIPVMLAIAHYGVGACHELALSVWFKILKNNLQACLVKFRGLSSYGHCVVLVGEVTPEKNDNISCLNQYSHDVLLIDPLIAYVGPANQYLNSQQEYLNHFDFQYFEDVLSISTKEIPFYQQLADELIRRLESQSLAKWIDSNLSYETSTIQKLNQLGPLRFFGHMDENTQINAFCTPKQPSEIQFVISLMHQLQAGIWVTFKSTNYFILPGTNMPSEIARQISLAKKIHHL
jgi:hypothetical protein